MPDLSGDTIPYDHQTRLMMALVDPVLDSDISGLESSDLEQKFLQNKLSREYLTTTGGPEEGAASDQSHRRKRSARAANVCESLVDENINFASMKNLRTTKAMMSDIDLLIPDPSEQARACRVLAAKGFEFYRFRLLAHPRKTMSKMSENDPRPVDIYPDAMWIRKVVCDAEAVVDRAGGPQATPCPADDLYLVATHAYSHMSVSFAELFHGVAILDESSIDWSIVIDNAREYGCFDGLYTYLLLLDEYLAATDRERIPERVFNRIPKELAVSLVDRWWENSTPRSYPVEIPTWLPTIVSSVHHVPRVASRLSLGELWKDFQSHYLAAASQVLLGEA